MQRHYEFIWLDVLIMFKHFSDDFRWICSVVSIGFCRLMEWWSYTVSDNQWYYKWRDKQLWQGVYCSVLFIGYKALRDGSKCFKLPKFKNKSSGHSGCFFLLHNILTPILSQMSHPFSSKMNLFHVDFFMICPNWYIMCLTQSDLHFSWKLDLRGYDDQTPQHRNAPAVAVSWHVAIIRISPNMDQQGWFPFLHITGQTLYRSWTWPPSQS